MKKKNVSKTLVVVLVLVCAVSVGAQSSPSEDLKQTQDRLDRAIEGVKKEVDALVAQRVAADQANALRFQIKELEASKAQIATRSTDQHRTIVEQKELLGKREAEYAKAIAECRAIIETLSAENAAIKKNIKRRALKRIFLFRW